MCSRLRTTCWPAPSNCAEVSLFSGGSRNWWSGGRGDPSSFPQSVPVCREARWSGGAHVSSPGGPARSPVTKRFMHFESKIASDCNKVPPRGRRDDMPPPPMAVRRWHIVSPPIRPSASVRRSKNRGGSASDRGRVRSPHISGGRRWLSCRQSTCRCQPAIAKVHYSQSVS